MFWNLKIGVKFYLFNPSDNFLGGKNSFFYLELSKMRVLSRAKCLSRE